MKILFCQAYSAFIFRQNFVLFEKALAQQNSPFIMSELLPLITQVFRDQALIDLKAENDKLSRKNWELKVENSRLRDQNNALVRQYITEVQNNTSNIEDIARLDDDLRLLRREETRILDEMKISGLDDVGRLALQSVRDEILGVEAEIRRLEEEEEADA